MGSVLYIAAHPDDENTNLITFLARGRRSARRICRSPAATADRTCSAPNSARRWALAALRSCSPRAGWNRRAAVLHARDGLRLLEGRRRDARTWGAARRSSSEHRAHDPLVSPDVIITRFSPEGPRQRTVITPRRPCWPSKRSARRRPDGVSRAAERAPAVASAPHPPQRRPGHRRGESRRRDAHAAFARNEPDGPGVVEGRGRRQRIPSRASVRRRSRPRSRGHAQDAGFRQLGGGRGLVGAAVRGTSRSSTRRRRPRRPTPRRRRHDLEPRAGRRGDRAQHPTRRIAGRSTAKDVRQRAGAARSASAVAGRWPTAGSRPATSARQLIGSCRRASG